MNFILLMHPTQRYNQQWFIKVAVKRRGKYFLGNLRFWWSRGQTNRYDQYMLVKNAKNYTRA